jgi:mono/diheme cytochrome c family protein
MRERWARALALATAVLLVLVAGLLAYWHSHSPGTGTDADPVAERQPDPSETGSAAELAAGGRALYAELRCANCHAIAGEGNARAPLDGVAQRHDAAALRAWIVGDPQLASGLPNRVRVGKSDYAALPEADLAALVAYLQSLPAEPGP